MVLISILPRLEPLEHPVLVRAVRQHPGGQPRPAERPVRREDPDVEQPVVDPCVGQQAEAAGQQPGVAHHDGPGLALDGAPRRRA